MASDNTSLFQYSFSNNVDFRPVYYYLNTTNRDGTKQRDRSINLRAGLLRLSYHLRDKLTFLVRAATRLSNSQENFRFRLRDEMHKPTDSDQARQIFELYKRFTISF